MFNIFWNVCSDLFVYNIPLKLIFFAWQRLDKHTLGIGIDSYVVYIFPVSQKPKNKKHFQLQYFRFNQTRVKQ